MLIVTRVRLGLVPVKIVISAEKYIHIYIKPAAVRQPARPRSWLERAGRVGAKIDTNGELFCEPNDSHGG
jgi:hypothetical protein